MGCQQFWAFTFRCYYTYYGLSVSLCIAWQQGTLCPQLLWPPLCLIEQKINKIFCYTMSEMSVIWYLFTWYCLSTWLWLPATLCIWLNYSHADIQYEYTCSCKSYCLIKYSFTYHSPFHVLNIEYLNRDAAFYITFKYSIHAWLLSLHT